MLEIKKEELRDFLDSRKDRIERPFLSGWGEIVSGESLIFTLFTSEFDADLLVSPDVLELLAWCLSLVLIGVGIYNLVMGFRLRQTVDNLHKSICELDAKRVHVVNIVLMHTPKTGKYLLIRNRDWNCDIFPSYNAITVPYDRKQEMQRLKNAVRRDMGVESVTITYLGSMEKHIKNCAGTDLPYRYEFHLFRAKTVDNVEGLRTYNGKKYIWKSLDSMLKNRNIMAKNADVVHYVADIHGIPYN